MHARGTGASRLRLVEPSVRRAGTFGGMAIMPLAKGVTTQ